MNWETYLSGTNSATAAGFTILTVIVISTSSNVIARIIRRQPTLKHGVLLSALVACLFAATFGIFTGTGQLSIINVTVAMNPKADQAQNMVGDISVLNDRELRGVETQPANS